MSDRFHQITMEQLTDWVFTELEEKDSISKARVLLKELED